MGEMLDKALKRPNTTGRGKYSKVIRELYGTITTMDEQCSRALTERDAKIEALVKALESARDFLDPDRSPPRLSNRDMVAQINGVLSDVGASQK